jgi:hypothetical protein
MKKLLLLALSLTVFTGCAEKNVEVAEEVAYIKMAAPAETAAPASRFSEYMWCKGGPDLNPETYAALTAAWNEIDARSTNKASGAFTIVPKVKTDLYDRMWVNIWPSVEARDAGWAEWVEQDAEAFAANFNSTLVCDPEKRFLFESFAVNAPTQQWDPAGPFQATYNFCSLKEGKTQEDGAAAAASFSEWLELSRAEGLGNNYMSHLLMPTFDPETAGGSVGGYQFVRGDFWANAEEQAADMAAWMTEGNAAREMSEATYGCQVGNFDLYPVKDLEI